jgi:hypothetical protein
VGDSVGVGDRLHGKVLMFGALRLIVESFDSLLAEWFCRCISYCGLSGKAAHISKMHVISGPGSLVKAYSINTLNFDSSVFCFSEIRFLPFVILGLCCLFSSSLPKCLSSLLALE